jgi:hypothetical protein
VAHPTVAASEDYEACRFVLLRDSFFFVLAFCSLSIFPLLVSVVSMETENPN